MDTKLRKMERYCDANTTDFEARHAFELAKWRASEANYFDWHCAGCYRFRDETQARPVTTADWWGTQKHSRKTICVSCEEQLMKLTGDAKDPQTAALEWWAKSDSLAAQFRFITIEYDEEALYHTEEHDPELRHGPVYDWDANASRVVREGDAIKPAFWGQLRNAEWELVKQHAARSETYMFFNSIF